MQRVYIINIHYAMSLSSFIYNKLKHIHCAIGM